MEMWQGVVAGAALAVGYLVHGAARDVPKDAVATALKVGSTGLLALAGVAAGAPVAVVAGLALGAAGDFALTRAGQGAFMAGMAAFAAGHLAYAAAFWGIGAAPGWALLPLAALALSTESWLAPRTGALRWPVRAYVAVICAMAALAAGLPAGHGLLQAGVALFVLSDLLLAMAVFTAAQRWQRPLGLALWPAYWGGQALILAGSLSMRPPIA